MSCRPWILPKVCSHETSIWCSTRNCREEDISLVGNNRNFWWGTCASFSENCEAERNLLPTIDRLPLERPWRILKQLQPQVVGISHIRQGRVGHAGARIIQLYASLPQRSDSCFQVVGPDASVRKSYRMIRAGRRQFQERVPIDLKIDKSWFAFLVLERECFAKAHGLRVEVHGFVEILDIHSDVIQPKTRHLFLRRGTGRRHERSEAGSRNKQCQSTHPTHVNLPEIQDSSHRSVAPRNTPTKTLVGHRYGSRRGQSASTERLAAPWCYESRCR